MVDAREKRLLKLYGLDNRRYNAMIRRQGGACAICLRPPKPGRKLHVDHDHARAAKGRVRGGLCWRCNHRFLGRGREDAGMHERAAAYLRSTYDARQAGDRQHLARWLADDVANGAVYTAADLNAQVDSILASSPPPTAMRARRTR